MPGIFKTKLEPPETPDVSKCKKVLANLKVLPLAVDLKYCIAAISAELWLSFTSLLVVTPQPPQNY